ncbi:PadR family transcriptional regulator [Fodinicurvata halophila]|uniref:PadR family transcriptional regulator n=1 Tax=Fodinicurvata halophila TaxID=1419723 RepID=A0ABV8UJM6_9PROT
MSENAESPAAERAHLDLTCPAYWRGTIKMGLSRFFILRVLHDGPLHGYDIARAVARTTNGCCSPTEGALYPALKEFEKGGYVTVTPQIVGGRTRKVYSLTARGRTAFQVALDAWMEVTDCLLDTERQFGQPAERAEQEEER